MKALTFVGGNRNYGSKDTARFFVEVEAKIAFKPMWCCLLTSQAEYIIQKKYELSNTKWYCNYATKLFLFGAAF